MRKTTGKLIINTALLLDGLVMTFSGLLIQLVYHMGHHSGTEKSDRILGSDYYGWSVIHKVSIVVVTAIIVLHIIQHWKWYTTVIRKRLFTGNREALILSVVFILVAVTGYIPWVTRLCGGDEVTRNTFLEIHDKLALLLFIYLILHVAKRLKWYFSTIRKLKSRNKQDIMR